MAEYTSGNLFRQIMAFVRVDLIFFVRFWYISLFTLGMTVFYFLMLTRYADGVPYVDVTLVFVTLGVLAVVLFQCGGRVAMERLDRWSPFLRTLPVPVWARLGARLILVVLAGGLAAALIMVAGMIRFDVVYDLSAILRAAVSVPLAVAVFAPASACVGARAHPNFAPALTTVLFLAITWSSGVWTRSAVPLILAPVDFLLPVQAVQRVAAAVTSAEWSDLLSGVAVVALWSLPASLLAHRLASRSEARQ